MCERLMIRTPLSVVYDYFEVHDVRVSELPPRFNVAPNAQIAIVRDDSWNVRRTHVA